MSLVDEGRSLRQIIITDLTEMSTGKYCVAGWDWERQCMVRLLNSRGGNWTNLDVGPTKLWDRRLVQFRPVQISHNRAFPHATEDTWIDKNMEFFARPEDWRAIILQSEEKNIDAVFDKLLSDCGALKRQKPFVLSDSRCASLGAVRAEASSFEFYEDTYDPNKPKLRCRFLDGFLRFDLTVSSYRLRKRWRQIGVHEMNARQSDFGQVHVRVGLAESWADKNKCYLMLNGLYRAQDS